MGGVTIAHRTVQTNGISMHVASAGDERGRPVVLCHGFPELWYSWRHQLPALADAGYRAVAPDQRGFGGTDRPEAVEAYDIFHLADDLIGLLDALDLESAVFVGHDWGAPVVWHLAQRVPERVDAVAALSVPFTPRARMRPTDAWEAAAPDHFFYVRYFQEPGVADEELDRDPRRTLRDFLWTISGDAPRGAWKLLPRDGTFLDSLSSPPVLPAWLSDDDLDVYAAEFARAGFTGGLNWYRNSDRNWELTEALAGRKVEVPALFIAGERDPVLRLSPPDAMHEWVPDLRGCVVLPGAGHWTQQERPAEVNRALLDFLAGL
ncbi:MAG: alpha/beta fold hydrolase [Actinomycetota bacterium]